MKNFVKLSEIGKCDIILKEITFEYSILPNDLPRNITKKRLKVKGEIWEIHKNDADPFPSNPHAHNYEQDVKLHLGTGDLYRNHDIVSKIKRKNLEKIRSKLESFDLPDLEPDEVK